MTSPFSNDIFSHFRRMSLAQERSREPTHRPHEQAPFKTVLEIA